MREISNTSFGPSGDWSFLDIADVTSAAGDRIERSLASMTPRAIERTLVRLRGYPIHHLIDRTN
jgi:hypothetical protein